MSAYTAAILRYGLIAPVALNGVMLVAAVYGNSRLSQVISRRDEAYREFKAREAEVARTDQALEPRRATFEDQKLVLKMDPALAYPLVLDTQIPKYKPLELERNSLVFPPEPGPLNRGVATAAVRVRTTWEGGYGPMQEILLQLESVLPQATLEDLKVSRKAGLLSGQPERLAIEMTHVCWSVAHQEDSGS
jgi:hypothetical protein